MNRFVLPLAVGIIASSAAAQGIAAKIPVFNPRVTDIASIRDTTMGASQSLNEASLAPTGKLVAVTNDNGLAIVKPGDRSFSMILTGYSESPTWSPSGDVVVVSRATEDGNQEMLWAVRVDPTSGAVVGRPWRVSTTPVTGFSPSFSPDGKSLAFVRRDSGGRSSLVIVPINGGPERTLVDRAHVRRLRWAREGKNIWYVEYVEPVGKAARINSVPAGGGAPRLILEVPVGMRQEAPIILANGRGFARYADHGPGSPETAHAPCFRSPYRMCPRGTFHPTRPRRPANARATLAVAHLAQHADRPPPCPAPVRVPPRPITGAGRDACRLAVLALELA